MENEEKMMNRRMEEEKGREESTVTRKDKVEERNWRLT